MSDKKYFILVILVGLALACVTMIPSPKPTIFIIREYAAESLQGPCTIVDYTINGYATSAVFYDYELDRYFEFLAELESQGRIVR